MTSGPQTAYYRGDGVARPGAALPEPPPWRRFPRLPAAEVFCPTPELKQAVNAALILRRPLLITGPPGTGKSTVIEQVAHELDLGPVLRWHITSRSTLSDALYRYDALGRIHAQRLGQQDEVAAFLALGPLGSALLPPGPRALLVDEIDKADLDLPGDLLEVLERGEFRIPELLREGQDCAQVRIWDSEEKAQVEHGLVQCSEFPFIVMTSNGEQELPPPFLRRCVRFTMPLPSEELIQDVVRQHLGIDVADGGPIAELVTDFVNRVSSGETLALDQLLNALHLMNGSTELPRGLFELVLKDLSRA
ncbi:MoxR family ATPase [Streptomyces sp. PCS3-D2]|uniref:AAA family ATPase n=1 Tax=Streptomyces sp. PCS3-D2 TaxID=1460244 RepID=UPI00044B229E|nr:MoxR family ATPase [Streptomyces sp. PCS3-D2]WKV75807.1 MoxR family ATPase [Streptomyces sp. PCS3-D2]